MRLTSPGSFFRSRNVIATDRHGTLRPGPLASHKFALLLKYSDKARAAETQLASLPDKLRERFRREAVADPARITEIAARLLAEDQNRRSPFGDPKLDSVYQMVKGDEDRPKELARIADGPGAGRRQPPPNHGVAAVMDAVEPPQAREERRRRIAEITGGVKKLGLIFARQMPSTAAAASTVFKPPKQSPARSDGSRESRRTATAHQLTMGSSVVHEQTTEPAVASNPAGTESPENPRGKLRAPSTKSLKWPLWLAAAAAAVALASFGELALMLPTLDRAQHRPVTAEVPQPRASEEAASREAVARAAEAEGATRKLVEQERLAEEAEKKKVEEAAVRREQEARKAEREDQQARIETARQEAEARDRAAAQEAERRHAEEARRAEDIAAAKVAAGGPSSKTEISSQKSEAMLNLSELDRKQVQVALTALGHEVPATGYFGQITRTKIADWQKTQGLPPSGFLDSSQLAALHTQAASAAGDAGSKKTARQADIVPNLSKQERKRVQVALTALGHPVSDTGNIGPKTRARITEWQKSQGLLPSGYLDSSQLGMLLQQAAPVLAKYDQREPADPRR